MTGQPPANSLTPESVNEPVFGPGLRWWRAQVDQLGHLPGRRQFTPADLGAKALPHVILVDIAGDARELRFRLMGTAHVAFNRRDFKGLAFEQVYESSTLLAYVRGLYQELCSLKRPIWSINDLPHPNTGARLRMWRLMLPLASDGTTVDMSVGIQFIDYPDDVGRDSAHPWHSASKTGELLRVAL
jgi:hypothetical protein